MIKEKVFQQDKPHLCGASRGMKQMTWMCHSAAAHLFRCEETYRSSFKQGCSRACPLQGGLQGVLPGPSGAPEVGPAGSRGPFISYRRGCFQSRLEPQHLLPSLSPASTPQPPPPQPPPQPVYTLSTPPTPCLCALFTSPPPTSLPPPTPISPPPPPGPPRCLFTTATKEAD